MVDSRGSGSRPGRGRDGSRGGSRPGGRDGGQRGSRSGSQGRGRPVRPTDDGRVNPRGAGGKTSKGNPRSSKTNNRSADQGKGRKSGGSGRMTEAELKARYDEIRAENGTGVRSVKNVTARDVRQAKRKARKASPTQGRKRIRTKSSAARTVFSMVMVLVVGIFVVFAGGAVMGSTLASNGSQEWNSHGEDIARGALPGVSTLQDTQGNTLAHFYDQNRREVGSDGVSKVMKDAIVNIEDKRFFDHNGVDMRGLVRSAVNNVGSDSTQGASTLDMQIAKNHRWLIRGEDGATSLSANRKIKDILTAYELDKTLSKDQVLMRYLNLVPFGQGSYGIEAAAQTFFGIPAKELNLPQSALLAGMVQSPEYNDPWNYPDHAVERRNTVLETLRGTYPDKDIDAAKKSDLGVLKAPRRVSKGCTGADADLQAGFFCQYVVDNLTNRGMTEDQIINGGYTIKTTLDPVMQKATLDAVRSTTNPQENNVQTVASFVNPTDDRGVSAMVSSRVYGVDEDKDETTMGTPFLPVGAGGGSTFKLFTAATYMQQGGRASDMLDNPQSTSEYGLGSSGGACAEGAWCVSNLGSYKSPMSLRDGLAQSPNTLFAKLINRAGVDSVVDTSIAMGLRGYNTPQSEGSESVKDQVVGGNQGSYTLGVTPVNGLEMSNALATIADNGRWCAPDPIVSVTDRDGNPVELKDTPCEQVLSPDVANELGEAMTHDVVGSGTAAATAKAEGLTAKVSSKTGTTDSSMSNSFAGFTHGENAVAGYVYTFSDKENSPLCWTGANTVACGDGNSFGAQGPGTTWMRSVINAGING